MNKTLILSFSLRNTYRVNSILYSLKQIPLIKLLLPEYLYQVTGLKIFANVLTVIWELISTFLGKLLYLLLMVSGMSLLYDNLPSEQTFLHILLFLTAVGVIMNTHLFNPTKDKYYGIILMRMDAREYTVANYIFALVKIVVGFLPFMLWLGRSAELPLWLCLLIPFSIAGCKTTSAAYCLHNFQRTGNAYNENKLSKYQWLVIGTLLAAAYALPALGIALPTAVSMAVMLAAIPIGLLCLGKVNAFKDYRAMNQQLLSEVFTQMDKVVQATREATAKKISADTSVTSKRKGFEYLNELFIIRHKGILWNSTRKIAYVCLFIVAGIMLILYLVPEAKPEVNRIVLTYLPYFTFIMYLINRGTGFTQALFMNCDHSLLTYSFYKQPKPLLKLFQIRLREIMKINAVPALVIGVGLALTLYVSGGTDTYLNYVVLIVSVLAMSMFFSVHYLTVYYLLQPYNAGTELKSGMYKVIMSVTYLCCFYLMQLRMPTLIFGIMTIVFCVVYSIVACALVYFLAPVTFKLRA